MNSNVKPNMLSQLIGDTLKPGVEKILALKQNSEEDSSERVQEIYRNEILPTLLQLRLQNRIEKDLLEERSKKVKELNHKLIDLQESCDSISFLTSCLNADVEQMKLGVTSKVITRPSIAGLLNPQTNGLSSTGTTQSSDESAYMDADDAVDVFDIKVVEKFDHDMRMRLLDEEELRRKDLQERLKESSKETKAIEATCSQGAIKLDQVKPYIKQLLEKAGPVVNAKELIGTTTPAGE